MLKEHIAYLIMFFKTQFGGSLLTDSELWRVVDCFESDTYYDEDVYSAKSQKTNAIGLVYSGLFKCVQTSKLNKPKIIDLFFPKYNFVVVDWQSFLSGEASKYDIISVKTSVVLSISKSKFEKLCQEIPCINSLCRRMIYHSCTVRKELLIEYIDWDCETKRKYFDAEYPNVSNKITLIQLGEFFGVSKTSFKKKKHP